MPYIMAPVVGEWSTKDELSNAAKRTLTEAALAGAKPLRRQSLIALTASSTSTSLPRPLM
jgi:hypothetical protein